MRAPRRWMAGLLVLSLVVALFPVAKVRAASMQPPLSVRAAVLSLQAYGIVDNKPEMELRLGDSITRAELAKILGATLKEQKMAEASQDRPAFPDTAGHWANGWIAVTKSRGLFKGREDGRFDPAAPVNYAEVITALLRLLGRGDEAARGGWPFGPVTAAADLGMLPADMNLGGRLLEPATRGDVFRLTAIAIGSIRLSGTGKTLLQSQGDNTPPTLVMNDRYPRLSEQKNVIISGKAGDAVAVYVGGISADLLPDGTFTVQSSLQPGENVLPVTAIDGAGNRAETSVTIRYQQLTRIQIEPPVIESAVGASFVPTVTRMDEGGRATSTEDIAWSYDTAAITRDPKTGDFKPLQSGEYTLRARLGDHESTARVIVAGEPATVEVTLDDSTLAAESSPTRVRIRVLDAVGRLNTAGNLSVQLKTIPDGIVTVDSNSIKTVNGQATAYLAPGSKTGAAGLLATLSAPKQKIESALVPVSVEPRRFSGIKLSATPANTTLAANLPVEIVATAVDQSGAPIPVMEDVSVVLRTSDANVLRLTRETALIRKGMMASNINGLNGTAVTTGRAGSVTLSGGFRNMAIAPVTFTADRAQATAALKLDATEVVSLADELHAAVVTVTRLDVNGQVAHFDQTPIVLMTPTKGVSITQMDDRGGVASFAIRTSSAGRITLTAGEAGLPDLNSQSVEVGFMKAASNPGKAVIMVENKTLQAGEATHVYVALADSYGSPVPNPGPPLVYEVEIAGDGSLSTNRFVIPTGGTRSDEAKLIAPLKPGRIGLNGGLAGGKPLSAASITVTQPAAPKLPRLTGNNLIAVAADPTTRLEPGQETRVTVLAREDEELLRGSYAFTLKVRENGEELSVMPSTLTVTLGGKNVIGLTGRTQGGEAELWVRYTGTGEIQIEPVPAEASNEAYDQWGLKGSALSSKGFRVGKPLPEVTYKAGPLAQLRVEATPNLGDRMSGVMKASNGRFITVRLTPTDDWGNAAGSACVASLTRLDDGGGLVGIRVGSELLSDFYAPITSSGSAEFTIVTESEAESESEWVPRVVCGSTTLTTADNVLVRATRATVAKPSIEFIGGDVKGSSSISSLDEFVAIRIARLPQVIVPVEVLVYDQLTGVVVDRLGPVYPDSTDPEKRTVYMPKKRLGPQSRTVTVQVRLNSGANVSDPSPIRSIFYTAVYTPE